MNDMFFRLVLLANLGSTLFMVGLIWFVQIVHYPLFARVGARDFPRYEKEHSHLTSLTVAPPMLVEAATAIGLLFVKRGSFPSWSIWTGLGLVVVIWLSTAAIQMPCHARLEAGFDAAVHRRLVRSNWIRTLAWTLRSWIALYLVWGNAS
jgi:hypothetical protein